MKWSLPITPVLMITLVLAVLSACEQPLPDEAPTTLAVAIAGEMFDLELALDDATRFQGLSDRDHIAADGGMLFVFDRPRQLRFVMRRCLVPIDLVFVGPNGRIVAMHAMPVEDDPDKPDDQLKHYPSKYPAQYAVELKDGSIDRLGLELGQEIRLPHDDLKRWVR